MLISKSKNADQIIAKGFRGQENKNFEAAKSYFEEAINTAPNSIAAYLFLAFLFRDHYKDYELAASYIKKLLN